MASKAAELMICIFLESIALQARWAGILSFIMGLSSVHLETVQENLLNSI